MQIFEAFGIEITRFAVGRILRKNKHKLLPGGGPSWLTFIGHMKDSLWSVDLFRCESSTLKSHWIMVVLDEHTRRIIGFAVHAGDCDGIAYCRLFNNIISGEELPKYLSSDNDPLYLFHRWQANLSILGIDEIKSVPGNPTSHPFVERVIGTTRREYLDHMLFFNERDLQNNLDKIQAYYNDVRAHSSLNMKTPRAMTFGEEPDEKVVSIDRAIPASMIFVPPRRGRMAGERFYEVNRRRRSRRGIREIFPSHSTLVGLLMHQCFAKHRPGFWLK